MSWRGQRVISNASWTVACNRRMVRGVGVAANVANVCGTRFSKLHDKEMHNYSVSRKVNCTDFTPGFSTLRKTSG